MILPGVGAFADAMEALGKSGLIPVIRETAASGVPFLGICLGMQALFDGSEEGAGVAGLGLIPGMVRASARLRTENPPHGVEQPAAAKAQPAAGRLPEEPYVYFVHSYACEAQRPEDVLTTTEYGRPFHSAVQRGNVMGMQFHPEKSGLTRQRLLRNFVEMTRAASGKEG